MKIRKKLRTNIDFRKKKTNYCSSINWYDCIPYQILYTFAYKIRLCFVKRLFIEGIK